VLAKNKVVYIGVAVVFVAISAAVFLNTAEAEYTGVTREFYLFSVVDENIDEDNLGIPPDQFSQTQITVRKGDTVKIHFYNLEPVETQEVHTFTILDGPYEMNHEVNAGEHAVIEFVADKRGIWEYICTEHQPTMRGQLVVWP
jgi:plastocyanin